MSMPSPDPLADLPWPKPEAPSEAVSAKICGACTKNLCAKRGMSALGRLSLCLAVSGLVDAAVVRWPARRTLLATAVAVIVGALMGRTVVRNRDWRDRVTLWSATVAVVPRCARAQYNLGQAYFERSRLADAERAWLAAAVLQPDDRETTRGLAMLYYRLGNHELAAAKIDAVIAAKPDDGEAQTLAGYIALDRGMPDRARAYFDAALVVLPAAAAEKARSGRDRALRATDARGVR